MIYKAKTLVREIYIVKNFKQIHLFHKVDKILYYLVNLFPKCKNNVNFMEYSYISDQLLLIQLIIGWNQPLNLMLKTVIHMFSYIQDIMDY